MAVISVGTKSSSSAAKNVNRYIVKIIISCNTSCAKHSAIQAFFRSLSVCILAACSLLVTPAYAQRYTPIDLCTTSSDSDFESITLPIELNGEYPSGSVQSIDILVGDTEFPGGSQAFTGDKENVIISLDSDNDGTPEQLSNASCLYDQAATPAGCTVTQTISIPTVTEDTTFRGRVTLSYDDLLPANGCGANIEGDEEDFLIIANVLETITIADVSAAEDGGPITLTATLSHNIRNENGFVPFTVDFQTSDGSATTADNDYTATTGTLSFNGQANDSETFTVTPTAGIVPEGDQTFTVALLNLSNSTHGIDISDTATVTLLEDDTEVELSLVKSVSNNQPNFGEVVVFTLQVNNAGPDAAVDASVEDVLPTGFSSITPVSVPGGSALVVSGNTVYWTGIDVPVGGSTSATFSAEVVVQ